MTETTEPKKYSTRHKARIPISFDWLSAIFRGDAQVSEKDPCYETLWINTIYKPRDVFGDAYIIANSDAFPVGVEGAVPETYWAEFAGKRKKYHQEKKGRLCLFKLPVLWMEGASGSKEFLTDLFLGKGKTPFPDDVEVLDVYRDERSEHLSFVLQSYSSFDVVGCFEEIPSRKFWLSSHEPHGYGVNASSLIDSEHIAGGLAHMALYQAGGDIEKARLRCQQIKALPTE